MDNIPDHDPQETRSGSPRSTACSQHEGPDRAHFLIER